MEPHGRVPAGRANDVIKLTREFVLYAIGSGLSVVMQLLLLGLFHEWVGFEERWAYLVAVALSFTVNFLYLRYVVYAGAVGRLSVLLGRTLAVSLAFRLVEWVLFVVIYPRVAVNYVVLSFVLMAGLFVLKFVVYRTWVFGKGRRAAR